MRSFTKRFVSGLLALVMVFIMLPATIMSVSAEETDNTMPMIEKRRLELINGINDSNNFVNFVSGAFDTNYFTKGIEKSKAQKNWGKASTGLKHASSVLELVDVFTDKTPAGPFVKAASKLCGLLSDIAGDKANANESEQFMQHINNLQDDLTDKLGVVSNQIIELSKSNQENFNNIATLIVGVAELSKYESAINEFTSSTSGVNRFSGLPFYGVEGTGWKYKLYMAYSALLEAEAKVSFGQPLKIVVSTPYGPETVEVDISYYYDNLYLVAKDISVLYEYLTVGENIGMDITLQEALYRYSLLQSSAGVDTDAYSAMIQKCIEYPLDWYYTYEFAHKCIELCYNFQNETLHKLIDGNLGFSTDYTISREGISETILYTDIQMFLADPNKNLRALQVEMAKYFSRVLALDESYIYEPAYNNTLERSATADAELYEVQYREVNQTFDENTYMVKKYSTNDTKEEFYLRTNNRVQKGDIVYMNLMPEKFALLFYDGDFTFAVDKVELAKVNSAGVMQIIGDSGSFTVTMYYMQVPVYSMTFVIEDNPFAGGMGCESAPYLISNWDEFVAIASEYEYYGTNNIHFKLIKDINLEHQSISPISLFSGVFDGDGHRIYDFTILTVANNVGLFGETTSTAQIKNLTIGDINGDKYSTSISIAEYCAQQISVGALVGHNVGVIENCYVVNTCVRSILGQYGGSNYQYQNIGGLTGYNDGTISMSGVEQSRIEGYHNLTALNRRMIKIGGLVGVSWNKILNSISYNNEIYGSVIQDKLGIFHSVIRLGGLAGEAMSGAVFEKCYTYGNNISSLDSNGEIQTSIFVGCDNASQRDYYDSKKMEITALPTVNTIGTQKQSVLNYVRGETRYKYLNADNEIVYYPLSSHRIDTSAIGQQNVVQLEKIETSEDEGPVLYKKTEIPITVVEESISDVVVLTPPTDTSTLSGLRLVVTYDNGETEVVDGAGNYTVIRDHVDQGIIILATPTSLVVVNIDNSRTHEYRINGGDWQSSSYFAGLYPSTAYKIETRYAAIGETISAGDITTVTITTPEVTDHRSGNYLDTDRPKLDGYTFKHSCSFQNNIAINYYAPRDVLADFSNVRLLIEKYKYNEDGSAYTIDQVVLSDAKAVTSGGVKYYKFTYDDVAAKEMGDEIFATLYAEKNGVTYYSPIDSFSAKEYAETLLSMDSTDVSLKAVLVDMLNYGAAAQAYFNYKTMYPANKDMTQDQLASGTQNVPTLNSCLNEKENTEATANFVGKSVVFNSSVELKYYMTFAAEQDMSNVRLILRYTTVVGTEVEKIIPVSEFTYNSSNKRYSAKFIEVAAKDMGCEIVAVIYDGDTPISNELTFSIESYASIITSAGSYSDTLCNLLNSMMNYSRAAKTYFLCGELGHDTTAYGAKAVTCTESGWNAYVVCSRCGYSTYQEIPALGHTEIIDTGYDVSCNTDGLSNGKYCSTCGYVFVEQVFIPATGHSFVDGSCENCTVKTKITYDSGYEQKKIDASNEYTYDTFNLNDMAEFFTSDYSIAFNIQVYMKEEDAGYQEIYLCNKDGTHLTGNGAYEYGGSGDAYKTSTWVTFNWTLSGNQCTTTMNMRYGAHGSGSDDWYRSRAIITATVVGY